MRLFVSLSRTVCCCQNPNQFEPKPSLRSILGSALESCPRIAVKSTCSFDAIHLLTLHMLIFKRMHLHVEMRSTARLLCCIRHRFCKGNFSDDGAGKVRPHLRFVVVAAVAPALGKVADETLSRRPHLECTCSVRCVMLCSVQRHAHDTR